MRRKTRRWEPKMWFQCLSLAALASCGQLPVPGAGGTQDPAAAASAAGVLGGKGQSVTILGTYKEDTVSAEVSEAASEEALYLTALTQMACAPKKATLGTSCKVAISGSTLVDTKCSLSGVAFGCTITPDKVAIPVKFVLGGEDKGNSITVGAGELSMELVYNSADGTAEAVVSATSEAAKGAADQIAELSLDDVSNYIKGSWKAKCLDCEPGDFPDEMYLTLIPADINADKMMSIWDSESAVACGVDKGKIKFQFDSKELKVSKIDDYVGSLQKIYDDLSDGVRFTLSDIAQKKLAAGTMVQAGSTNFYDPAKAAANGQNQKPINPI